MAPAARSDREERSGRTRRSTTGPIRSRRLGVRVPTVRALPRQGVQSIVIVSPNHTMFVWLNREDLTDDCEGDRRRTGGVYPMWTPMFSKQELKRTDVTDRGTFAQLEGHPAFNRRDEGSSPLRPTARQQARGVAAAHPALTR